MADTSRITAGLAATGQLGSGFRTSSLRAGLALRPQFIGCDAGSNDFGPYYLGSGQAHFSESAIRRDLERLIEAALSADIPLIIGSAGTTGTDAHVRRYLELSAEIVKRLGRHTRAAGIYCEQDPKRIIALAESDLVRPLSGAGSAVPLHEQIRRCTRIVAMAGVEPIDRALQEGARLVICGRVSDAAIYAAPAIRAGVPDGLAWHAGKILECGTACTVERRYPDCMFAEFNEHAFAVIPPNPELSCTPTSVAAHNLYETASPFLMAEPGGTLDTTEAEYRPWGDRGVCVTGSRFIAGEPTFKLEGAVKVGYQSLCLGAVRDPVLIGHLSVWLTDLEKRLRERFAELAGDHGWTLNIRRYGIDGVMGERECEQDPCHEVLLVFEVTAEDQETSDLLAGVASHLALHHPIPRWTGLITALAIPHSPPVLERGPVYAWGLHHVVGPIDSEQLFTVEIEELR